MILVLRVRRLLTMALGNLGALVQTDLKRMLAYSGDRPRRHLLVAVMAALRCAATATGRDAALFYLAAYVFTTGAAFALIEHLGRELGPAQDVRALRGLARSRPLATPRSRSSCSPSAASR